MSGYQIMPNLTIDEFEALRDSVRRIGIQIPVEVDEAGVILDGHHRAAIAAELGIECPKVVREGLTEEDKVERVIDLNMARRHLSREQQRDLIHQLRDRGMSLRAIGTAVGVGVATVKRAVDEGVPNGTPDGENAGAQPHNPLTVVGRDGRTYTARRSPPAATRRPGDDARGSAGNVPRAPGRRLGTRTTGHALIANELGQLLQMYRGTRLRKVPPGDVAMAVAPTSAIRRAADLRALADHLGAVADALEARKRKER